MCGGLLLPWNIWREPIGFYSTLANYSRVDVHQFEHLRCWPAKSIASYTLNAPVFICFANSRVFLSSVSRISILGIYLPRQMWSSHQGFLDFQLALDFSNKVIGLQDGVKKFEGPTASVDQSTLEEIYAMEIL